MTAAARIESTFTAAKRSLFKLLKGIFYPIACICLRYGISEQQAGEVLRWCFVKAALSEPEFAARERNAFRQTISHAAVQTGLTRMETLRYSRLEEPEVDRVAHKTDRVARLLSAWLSDPRYHDAAGQPAELAMRGSHVSFEQLAMKWGRDAPPRSIADFLVGWGCAEWVDGKRKALRFISATRRNPGHAVDEWDALTSVSIGFFRTLNDALKPDAKLRPRFRQVLFPGVARSRAPDLRELLNERLAVFDKECENLISTYRTEIDADVVRGGVGFYTFFDSDKST